MPLLFSNNSLLFHPLLYMKIGSVSYTRVQELTGCDKNTLYNVCSTMGGVQYCGGYHGYCGGYLEYCGGYLEYCGGYHDKCGGYLEYRGDVQYHGGYHGTWGDIISTVGGKSFVI